MQKYSDYRTEDFLHDNDFIAWLSRPDKKSDEFWNRIIKEYPDKKANIEEARLIFRLLYGREETMGVSESVALWQKIRRKTAFSRRDLFIRIIKYAAVLILVFFSGGLCYYFYQTQGVHETSFEIAEAGQVYQDKEAKIILSDGSEVSLEPRVSQITYSANGKQLIVNNDTVVQASNSRPEQMNRIIIPYGKKSMIVLSDGTKVWLNAGSQLVYPSMFKAKVRQVMLIGEAYFDVAKDPEHPFQVKTSDVNVEVHGTKFDVLAYPEDKEIQAVLEEGHVSLRYTGKNLLSRDRIYDMQPNQMIVLKKESGDARSQIVDVSKYVAWKSGMLEIETEDLIRVIKQVERYYNIRIKLADPMIGGYKISGKLDLKNEPEDVLNIIGLTVPIDWQKNSNGEFVVFKK
jgi:ferric-dicitrate binding protein FerR (iron transport regulator)/uncharacterized protein (DUF2164 family)